MRTAFVKMCSILLGIACGGPVRAALPSAIVVVVAAAESSSKARSALWDSIGVWGTSKGEIPLWELEYVWLLCHPNFISLTSDTSYVERNTDEGISEVRVVS
jgi:hypothetical protein